MVAYLPMFVNACLLGFCLLVVVATLSRRPKIGFYMIVLGSVTENIFVEATLAGIPLKIRPTDALTILMVAVLLLRSLQEKGPVVLPPTFGLFVAFFAVMPLSLPWSSDVRAGMVTYLHRLILFLTALVVYQLAREPRIMRGGLKLLYFVGWIVSFLTVHAVVTAIRAGLGLVRPSVFPLGEAVYLGLFSLPLVGLLLWYPDWEPFTSKTGRIALLLLLIVGVVLSGSRISWYAVMICFILQARSTKDFSSLAVRRYLPLVGYLLVWLVIIAVSMDALGFVSLAPLAQRWALMIDRNNVLFVAMGGQMSRFLESPLLGVGMGSTPTILHEAAPYWWGIENRSVGGYSIITGPLSESGLLAFGLFVAALVQMWRLIRRMRTCGDRAGFLRASTLYFCILSTVVWSLFQPPVLNNAWFWLFVGLCWAALSPVQQPHRAPISHSIIG